MEPINRRQFLGAGVAAGIAIAAPGSPLDVMLRPREAAASVQVHDEFPVEISEEFRRFDQRNTVFSRGAWDEKIQPLAQKFGGSFYGFVPPSGQPGYGEVDHALWQAAWSVDQHAATDSEYGVPSQGLYEWKVEPNGKKAALPGPEETSRIVKKAAKFLGASLVGIADYDERWVYSELFHMHKNQSLPAEFPFQPQSVVVLAFEMDYEAYRTGPSMIAASATGLAYSQMAETAHKVATFIRRLGYRCIPCGNDTALSVPLAIAAGLGEAGRNGLLVTREFGPRVRLCKVLTELPLKADKPVTFGVKNFCRSCKLCAEACPGKAISLADETSVQGINISNCGGTDKWYADAEKCFRFWAENTADCCSCITSCPYNKPVSWHHDFTRKMADTPLAPVLSKLDTAFGFGKTFDEKAIRTWWEK